jgi:hypothetical protein
VRMCDGFIEWKILLFGCDKRERAGYFIGIFEDSVTLLWPMCVKIAFLGVCGLKILSCVFGRNFFWVVFDLLVLWAVFFDLLNLLENC